jgi:hypothetical protein
MILVEPPDSGRDACEKGGAMKIGVLLADAFRTRSTFFRNSRSRAPGRRRRSSRSAIPAFLCSMNIREYLSCLPRPRRVQTRNGVDTSAVPE